MQNEQKSEVKAEDPATKVIKKFGRQDDCIGCDGKTNLVETKYSEEEDVVQGRYECDCGYKQGINICGTFVEWYREAIMGEDMAEVRLQKEKAIDEAMKVEEEALQLPEVKVC